MRITFALFIRMIFRNSVFKTTQPVGRQQEGSDKHRLGRPLNNPRPACLVRTQANLLQLVLHSAASVTRAPLSRELLASMPSGSHPTRRRGRLALVCSVGEARLVRPNSSRSRSNSSKRQASARSANLRTHSSRLVVVSSAEEVHSAAINRSQHSVSPIRRMMAHGC